LWGVFRKIVYEGGAVQATLERYHQQLQQAWQRKRLGSGRREPQCNAKKGQDE
jgi:hypothetical protein